jgi:uncharacterized protein (DUF779 family)
MCYPLGNYIAGDQHVHFGTIGGAPLKMFPLEVNHQTTAWPLFISFLFIIEK